MPEKFPSQNHRDRIYELTAGRIQRGEIGPGDRLVDTALATELGVSRMPVRDALMRLAAEGYLEPTTRGFILPSLDAAKVLEVFEIRRLLEPRAAARAAQNLTAPQLTHLTSACDQARQTLGSRDSALFFRACEAFRNCWLAAVPNQTLQVSIHRYLAQVQTVRLTTMRDPASQQVIVAAQDDLLAAFAAHDSVTAADRMLLYVIEGEIAFRRLAPGVGR